MNLQLSSLKKHFLAYKWLYGILFLGLVVRLLFIWWAAYIYYPEPFYFRDSYSYVGAFMNLWQKGIYSFDLTEPDAQFGRLPAYPLFYGMHYLIFGQKYVYIALAHSQALIELLAVACLFFTLQKIAPSNKNKTAYIGAILYAFYPFTIVWTTPVYTESVSTSLTVIFFYLLYCLKKDAYYPIYLGLFVALCFYVREYLGILMISAGIGYIIFSKDFKQFLKWTCISALVFGSLYVLWPIRNYVSSGRIVLLKPASSGYKHFKMDIVNARKWLYAWTDSANYILEEIYQQDSIYEGNPIYLPSQVASTWKQKERIYQIINQSNYCGTGFRHWKSLPPLAEKEDCTDQLAHYYDSLFENFKANNRFTYYTHVPLKNFQKAFFKSQLNQSNAATSSKEILINVLFGYRSFLLLIGFTTLFIISIKHKRYLPISFFIVFMYFFINAYVRQVEMRYLLQADTVALLFSAIGISYCMDLFKIKKLPN